MATSEFVNCRENASSKTARLPGSQLEGVLFMSEGHSTRVPNHPLRSWIWTPMAWYIGTSCETPWYRLLGSTLEINFATKMTMLRLSVPGQWLIICSNRTSLKWISLHNPLTATPLSIRGTCNQQHESHPTLPPWTPPSPVASVGQYHCGTPEASGGQHAPATRGHYQR